MHLENIFELIRKEQVVLWIGSGFSLYAGYPTGAKLSEMIYHSLSESEKNEINPALTLMDLTEQYVRIKYGSRNALNSLLHKEFTKPAVTRKWHDILATIPHIKTIITTNYDRLFELAYKEDIFPIVKEGDLAYREDKTELFKVHGDILSPESIIITRSDYTDIFLKDIPNNLIWSAIKERISNKSVVFIGYDFEDENIKLILKKVNEALGENRKDFFLVAPGFKQTKVHYLSQFNLQYLDFKGEVFVDKLLRNIRDNAYSDFGKGYLSAETFRKFSMKHNLTVELKAEEKRFRLQSVETLKKDITQNMVIKLQNSQSGFLFDEFSKGNMFGEVVLDENVLQELKFTINDVNIIDDSAKYKLIFSSIPAREGIASVVFEDGAEFEDIQYQLFKSKSLLELSCTYRLSKYVFQVKVSDISDADGNIISNFTFTPTETFHNVNDAVLSFRFAVNIAKSIGFTVYPDHSAKGFDFQTKRDDFQSEKLESNLEYFESLKKVEQLYGMRFSKVGDYSREDFNNVFKAVQFANGGAYFQQWPDELKFDIDKDTPLNLLLTVENGATLRAESQVKEEILIYGQTIVLGYQILECSDLYIVNLKELQNKETPVARVKSRSGKIRVTFAQKNSIST